MNYSYRVKTFTDEKQVVKWLNDYKVNTEDIISISAYRAGDSYAPRFQVFYIVRK